MIERYHCSNKRLTFRPCQRARCPTRIPQNRAAHPKGTLLPARLPGPRCPWQPAWCPITIPRNRRCTPRGHRGLRVCQGRAVHGSWHGARSRFRGIALHMAVTAGRWRCRHHACAEGEWDRAAGPLLIGVAEAGASTQRGTHDRIKTQKYRFAASIRAGQRTVSRRSRSAWSTCSGWSQASARSPEVRRRFVEPASEPPRIRTGRPRCARRASQRSPAT